jgi:transcriptional regulator NrdR family protein
MIKKISAELLQMDEVAFVREESVWGETTIYNALVIEIFKQFKDDQKVKNKIDELFESKHKDIPYRIDVWPKRIIRK